MQLSQILNDLMDSRNLSAYKMSKDTGISDRLIGYWRKGDKLPSAENLIILANYFNTSVDFLLGRSEPNIIPTFTVFSLTEEEKANANLKKMVTNFELLNIQAQNAVIEYLNYVVSQPKNLKKQG